MVILIIRLVGFLEHVALYDVIKDSLSRHLFLFML